MMRKGIRMPDEAAEQVRVPAFDDLRSFGVLLVLLHHTVLAYVPFGFLNPADPMKTFSPIVNGARWVGFHRIGSRLGPGFS